MTTSVPARTWARSVATLVAAASFSEMWITCLAITRLYTAISPALLRTAGIEGAQHHGCAAVDLHCDGGCSISPDVDSKRRPMRSAHCWRDETLALSFEHRARTSTGACPIQESCKFVGSLAGRGHV